MALIIDSDDCLTHILEFLSARQLWLIIYASPSTLRNHQLYRCAWAALGKVGDPFALRSGLANTAFCLEDQYRVRVTAIRPDRVGLFQASALSHHVREAEISTLGSSPAALLIRSAWLTLLLPLPNIDSLILHADKDVSGYPLECFACPFDLADAFALTPAFARLKSFNFVCATGRGPGMSMDEVAGLRMIELMTGLESLEIPSSILLALTTNSADLCRSLLELKVYQKTRKFLTPYAVTVLIASGHFPELRRLHYRYEPSNGADCNADFSLLRSLPLLRELSIDVRSKFKARDSSTQLAPLPQLHVSANHFNSGTLQILASQCSSVSQLTVAVNSWRVDANAHLSSMIFTTAIKSNMRVLRISASVNHRRIASFAESAFITNCLMNCRQLEILDVAFPVFEFPGCANQAGKGLRAIIAELSSMPSIRDVRCVAKIDSISVVRAALPSNAKIIDFSTKPGQNLPRNVELLPEEREIPTRLTIVGEKDLPDRKPDDNLAKKFNIRVDAISGADDT